MFHYFFKEKAMKRQLATTAAILGFAAVSAHAQMSGGMTGGHGGMPGQGMSGQHSQQMMGGQMMNQEMMRDMSGMMRQMTDMMQGMSRAIDQHPMMDQDRMRDMAKLMEDMSATMREMSQQMAQGKMEPAMTRRMEERAGQMNRMLEELKKGAALSHER
jgi:hypothetical protein